MYDYLKYRTFMYVCSGAAIATTVSCVMGTSLAATLLLRAHGHLDQKRSLLSNIFRSSQLWLRPAVMKQLCSTSLALLAGSAINTATYSSGSFVSSSCSPRLSSSQLPLLLKSISATSNDILPALSATCSVASHQVSFQTWWFLSYFSSPMCLAAQSILQKDLKAGNESKVKKTIPIMLQINAIVGCFCTAVNAYLLLFGQSLFTSNQDVIQTFHKIAWQAVISQFLVCMTTVADGIFIGTNRVSEYLQACIVSTFSAWSYFYLVSIPLGLGTVGAWNGILIFAGTRTLYYLLLFLRSKFFLSHNKANA